MSIDQRKKTKKILNREISMYFSKELMYRKQLFAWILADIIKICGLCLVWIAASKMDETVSNGYIVSYYILIMLISKLTSDYTLEFGMRDIISGRFSNFLIKPFNYLTEYLGINIGNNILRFVLFIPAFIFGIFLSLKFNFWIITFNPFNIVLCCISIIFGFCISFLLGNIISLISMRVKEMDGIRIFYYNIASMLSGEFIPKVFLPIWGQYVLQILPFRYTLSFPVEILLGRLTTYDLNFGFILSIFWILILILIYRLMYKFSIKRYEAEGI